jgi:acetolactate decarboxylase
MSTEKTFNASAPFFVYANVNEWNEITLPEDIKSIKDIESYIDEKTKNQKRPFVFKLAGQVESAIIHIQNLPKGAKVSSPDEAHQGQTNFRIEDEGAEIVGFFSTQHQGVFTHHDSFLHMHLITLDELKMGHLDEIELGKMKLYLPQN